MLKQAILITAYKNYNHLIDIINFFDDNFEFYIHIDKKSRLSNNDFKKIKNSKKVKLLVQKYKVNWGSFNHLKSILYLAEKALENSNNYYFHLISGHDYPIKSVNEFNEYFYKKRDKNFLDYFDVPKNGWANNGGLDRLEYFNFFDLLNFKIPKQKRIIKKIVDIQKRVSFKRKFPDDFPKLYGGSTWWSLNKNTLKYVIDYTKKKKHILNRFKYSLCSEEFYFQTIILNSEYKNNVINDDMRYIDWVAKNGNNPAILDISDYSKIKASNSFFARKFEFPQSSNLLLKLKM